MSHKTGILRIETKLLSFKKLFLSISLSATCEEIGILFLFTWIFLVLYLSLSHNFKFRFTEVKPFLKELCFYSLCHYSKVRQKKR